jgi:hypothetical protein
MFCVSKLYADRNNARHANENVTTQVTTKINKPFSGLARDFLPSIPKEQVVLQDQDLYEITFVIEIIGMFYCSLDGRMKLETRGVILNDANAEEGCHKDKHGDANAQKDCIEKAYNQRKCDNDGDYKPFQ